MKKIQTKPINCKSSLMGIMGIAMISMLLGAQLFVKDAGANQDANIAVALKLAKMLRTARSVIAGHQAEINDATVGDKGITGERVVDEIMRMLTTDESFNTEEIGADSKMGRLLQAQMSAFKKIVDDNQPLINRKDVGFKGFVPAVFARLANEEFSNLVGSDAKLKVTAPLDLVRNRKSRPDAWEKSVINDKFKASDWRKGELYAEQTDVKGRVAFRVMVPEYYGQACLSCHGQTAGEMDITGYPKEGGKLDDLGGAISIILFH